MFINILKFTLGFLLAIAILATGSIVGALYVINRASIPPAKPVFANDTPLGKDQAPKSAVAKGKATHKPETQALKSSTPTPTESPQPLPAGAYRARVTWSQGLVLRSEPNQDAGRVGGVGFRQKIFVLEQTPDKTWQKIRLEGSNKEGWVKAGNTQQVDKNDSQQPEPAEPTQQ